MTDQESERPARSEIKAAACVENHHTRRTLFLHFLYEIKDAQTPTRRRALWFTLCLHVLRFLDRQLRTMTPIFE